MCTTGSLKVQDNFFYPMQQTTGLVYVTSYISYWSALNQSSGFNFIFDLACVGVPSRGFRASRAPGIPFPFFYKRYAMLPCRVLQSFFPLEQTWDL